MVAGKKKKKKKNGVFSSGLLTAAGLAWFGGQLLGLLEVTTLRAGGIPGAFLKRGVVFHNVAMDAMVKKRKPLQDRRF